MLESTLPSLGHQKQLSQISRTRCGYGSILSLDQFPWHKLPPRLLHSDCFFARNMPFSFLTCKFLWVQLDYMILEWNCLERLIPADSKLFLPFEWNKKTNPILMIHFGKSGKKLNVVIKHSWLKKLMNKWNVWNEVQFFLFHNFLYFIHLRSNFPNPFIHDILWIGNQLEHHYLRNLIWGFLIFFFFFTFSNLEKKIKNEPIARRHVSVEPANSIRNP